MAQLGRALGSGLRGRGFKSRRPDEQILRVFIALSIFLISDSFTIKMIHRNRSPHFEYFARKTIVYTKKRLTNHNFMV